jgi:hypothetical protein
MDWNWQPQTWKRRNKLLLGLATFWPPLYMVLFFVGHILNDDDLAVCIRARDPTSAAAKLTCFNSIRKLRMGDIQNLTLRQTEIVAVDRAGAIANNALFVSNESSREVILKIAREIVDGRPRVEKIEEDPSDQKFPRHFRLASCSFSEHIPDYHLDDGLDAFVHHPRGKKRAVDQTIEDCMGVLSCTVGMFYLSGLLVFVYLA